MFLRALRVCSEEFLEDEINFIFDIGKKHKYPMDILGKAYNNALKTFNSHTAREPFNLNNIFFSFTIPRKFRKFGSCLQNALQYKFDFQEYFYIKKFIN